MGHAKLLQNLYQVRVLVGEPEDQLRAPLECLFADLAEICGFKREWLTAVGESSLTTLKTRPDYAITLRTVLVGFVEVKAPGKGADPRRFKGHDKEQWEKLQSLPNLMYTDGNSFSLWQNGELVGSIVVLSGDIETSGTNFRDPEVTNCVVRGHIFINPWPSLMVSLLTE